MAALRAERAATEAAGLAFAAERVRRLQGLHEFGRLLASERRTYAQICDLLESRGRLYRAPALVPGLSVSDQSEWDAFLNGVGEVAALVTGTAGG